MKKRLTHCLALAFIAANATLSAQTVSVSGNSLSFDDPLTPNPSTAVGGFCVYNDVVSVNGTPYDAIMTIDAISNALIADFDADNTTNSNSSAHFSPSVLWTGAGSIQYTLTFIEDGTAGAPVPATLGDFYLTGWDFDAVGPAGRFLQATGMSSYTLGSNTVLSYTQSTIGSGTFTNTTTGSNTTGTDGKSRVTVGFSSASSVAFSIGASSAGSTTYLISGNNPGSWFPTTANETLIPVVNTFGTTAPFFTCDGIPSAGQGIWVEADHLTDSLIITAPAGYAVSAAMNGAYSSSLTLGADSTDMLDTTIYIAMDGTTPASDPADITISSTGASNVLISVSGTKGGALTASNFAKTDPTTCSGTDGVITFDVTNVPDGTYAITYEGGSTTANVLSGVATINGLGQGHYFDIVLTDATGCQTAMGNDLSLEDPIDFTVVYSPSDVNICAGSSATFGVITTGTATSFQWYTFTGGMWAAIPGETSSTFTTPSLTDTARYQVVATSTSDCQWTSLPVSANVNPIPVATLRAQLPVVQVQQTEVST